MTILDAANIKTLVETKWTLAHPNKEGVGVGVEKVTNGGFEDGYAATGWDGSPQASQDQAHSGTWSLLTYSASTYQEFATPIPVNNVTLAKFWAFNVNNEFAGSYCIITYSDESYTEIPFDGADDWEEIDILALLDAGKSITKITFNGGTSDFVYVDDVTIMSGATIEAEVVFELDEFNPNHPDYQVVFKNNPERVMYVTPNVIKHEQDVRVEVHTKLVRYEPTEIEDTYRPTILAMKEELTKIFNKNRFDTVGNALNHSSWKDAKFPHGRGTDPEPLTFVSVMTVQIHYYEAVSGDTTAIGLRPSSIEILGEDLLGVVDVNWADVDPWVMLQVPKGTIKKQHLLGPQVEGTIVCHDYNSLYTLLYTIPIVEGGSQYPINADMSKIVFSTNVPTTSQFVVSLIDVLGNVYIHNFFNVRIQKIVLTRASTSGLVPVTWTIHWVADYIYTTPPEEE